MASKDSEVVIVDQARSPREESAELSEEILKLKRQMAEMHWAWSSGMPPPPLADDMGNTSDHPPLSQTQFPVDTSPQFDPGFNPPQYQAGPSNVQFTAPQHGTGSYQAPLTIPILVAPPSQAAPTFVASPPVTFTRSASETRFKAFEDQRYNVEPILKVTDHYGYAQPSGFHFDTKKSPQEDMARKMRSLEQAMRNLQGPGGYKSVAYKDLCMFPNVNLPIGFKMPKFEKYDGHGDPVAHLRRFCNQLRRVGGREELLMAYFGESLTGLASEWFVDQELDKWHCWDYLANEFVQQFHYKIDLVPDEKSLANMKEKSMESFREYAIRWRKQAARVKPPLKENKIVEAFLQSQDETYFQHLIPAMGRSFIEVIKMGEVVEEGIKSGRLVSFAALKATTQAIQNGLGYLGFKKKKEDVAMVTEGSRQSFRIPPCPYTPNYPQAPTQHYYPQNVQVPYSSCSRQDYRKDQRPKDVFTLIGESYVNLYQKLRNLNMIGVLPQNNADPNSKGFNPNAWCAYHSGAQGHSTEEFRSLKREVERMIRAKLIVVQNSDPPNVNENPLTTHNDINLVEMVRYDQKCDRSLNARGKATELGEVSTKVIGQTSG